MKYYLFIQLFMVGALLQGFGSLIGAGMQDVNNQRTIRAQAKENEKNREYNLQLAKMQNEWNLEQWERENEYNNPLNVMARLKTAKLNPNLVYGQGAQSVSAPSPALTSGAPSSPQDMSLMSQRPTVGQIISQSLQNRVIQAQIENTEAQTKKTLSDANISDITAKYLDAEKQLGIKINERVYQKLEHEIDKAFEEAKAATYLVEKMNYEQLNQRIEYLFKERQMEAITSNLESQAKISKEDAKLAIESYFYRFLGIKSSAELAKFNAALPAQLEEKFGEDAGTAALILQGVQFLLGNANNIATFAGKNKPIHTTNQYINVGQ